MDTPVIEQNIPLTARTRSSNYQFLKDMPVGSSFSVTGDDAAEQVRRITQSAIKTHKVKTSYRAEGDGFRVWRTA